MMLQPAQVSTKVVSVQVMTAMGRQRLERGKGKIGAKPRRPIRKDLDEVEVKKDEEVAAQAKVELIEAEFEDCGDCDLWLQSPSMLILALYNHLS